MKKIICVMATVVLVMIMSGCQTAAKNFGGTVKLEIPENYKLMEITWKDNSLWYLARPMRTEEQAETYIFKEKTSMGLLEGIVEITETKR